MNNKVKSINECTLIVCQLINKSFHSGDLYNFNYIIMFIYIIILIT